MENGPDTAGSLRAGRKTLDLLDSSLLRLVSEPDPDRVVDLVAETAARLINAETVAVPTLSPGNQEVVYASAYGLHRAVFSNLSLPIDDAGLCGWVLDNRRPILTNNLLEDHRVKRELAAALGITSALLVPLIARGRIIGGISAFNKADGSPFTEEDSALLTRLAGYAAITIDNARLMEALGVEKLKLMATLDSIGDGIVFIKKDDTIVNANKTMERYLPMKVEEMIGANIREFAGIKPLASLFDWEAQARPGERCWEVFSCEPGGCPVHETNLLRCWSYSGGHCRKREYNGKEEEKTWAMCAHCEVLAEAARRLAEPRDVQAMDRDLRQTAFLKVSSVLLAMDEKKDVFGEVMVFRDVTAERRMERQRSEFISMLTHDLKTPITSIMGYLELVGQENDPARLKEMSMAARQSSNDLVKMIDDFLHLSRAEAGHITLNLSAIPPRSFLYSLHQQFLPQAAQKNIRLAYEVEEGAPDIMADMDALSRIIGNLVMNALKYARKGGNVRMRAFSPGAGFIAISVGDDGPGIGPEDLPRIFDKYYSGGRAKAGGSGLGLAIVKALTEAHGGAVDVKSEKGKGSLFTVRLPSPVKDKGPAGLRGA